MIIKILFIKLFILVLFFKIISSKIYNEKLIKKIVQENSELRTTLIFFENNILLTSDLDELLHTTLKETQLNVLTISNTTSNFTELNIFKKINANFLLIALITEHQINVSMNQIAEILFPERHTKILFIIYLSKIYNKNDTNQFFEQNIMPFCFKNGMLNYLLIFKNITNWNYELIIYRVRPFPQLQIDSFIYNESLNEVLYPDRTRNLQGYKIRTAIYHSPPRTISYINRSV